jgi:hypothetical protein
MSLINAPSFEDLSAYDVNVVGKYEVCRQTLYDTVAYAAAGQSSLSFFQLPVGQGGKTVQDTNMTSAGSLPSPVNFLIESVELIFIPGTTPLVEGAGSAAPWYSDMQSFRDNGSLRLTIGDKSQLLEAPLGVFPPKTGLNVNAAISNNITPAAATKTSFVYADMVGRPYYIDVPLLLRPTQNFDIKLEWKVPIALPSTTAGRIICKLDGLRYRLAQ